nr:hypothetical protein [Maliibacterium massiliense]
MKVAVVGSRTRYVPDLTPYLPRDTTEIVTGGANGIDRCADAYARAHGLKCTIFYPAYQRYGRTAPLHRNLEIIAYADVVVALWDGKSRGTHFVIENCKSAQKLCTVYLL